MLMNKAGNNVRRTNGNIELQLDTWQHGSNLSVAEPSIMFISHRSGINTGLFINNKTSGRTWLELPVFFKTEYGAPKTGPQKAALKTTTTKRDHDSFKSWLVRALPTLVGKQRCEHWYLTWGWRSSSTEPPPPSFVPRTGSRTPTERGRNGRRWPRLDSAEPPRPDTAPRRRTAGRWSWKVGTRTPRSRTSSRQVNGAAGWSNGGSPPVRPSSTLPPHTAPQPAALLCARTSWESLAAHFRLERTFKTRDSFIRFDIRNVPDVPFSQRTHSSLTLCYFILSILNLSTWKLHTTPLFNSFSS